MLSYVEDVLGQEEFDQLDPLVMQFEPNLDSNSTAKLIALYIVQGLWILTLTLRSSSNPLMKTLDKQ